MRLAQSALVAFAFIAAGSTAVLADSQTPAADATKAPQTQAATKPVAPPVSATAAADKHPAKVAHAVHHTLIRTAAAKPVRPHARYAYVPYLPVPRSTLHRTQPERLASNTRCESFFCPGYILVGIGF